MADEAKVDFGRNPFQFTKKDTYAVVKLTEEMDQDLAKEFEKRIRPQLEGLTVDLVFDLTDCGEFHPQWTRLLMQVATLVKTAGKKLRVVSTHERHRNFFQEQGITGSFPFSVVPTVETAAAEMAAKKSNKLDENFINPFLEGTIEVLKIQAQTTAKAGLPKSKDPRAPFGGDISGVIGLVSETFTGSVVISFPAATFLAIMSRMLGEEYKELTPEISDGAAEMTNIIFGYAKRVLNEKGYGIKMAIPSVISGKDHSIQNHTNGPRLSIPFESDAGVFSIEVCLGD